MGDLLRQKCLELLLSPCLFAVFVFASHCFDLAFCDGGSFVAKAVADVGGYIGDPFVRVAMLGGHEAIVGFAIYWSFESV